MQKGNIGVTTDNIFPVIKKFLYSDHEIFLREIISNAVDATQKLKTLSEMGKFEGELGDLTVKVKIDKEAGTLTVSDSGIGMTEEEIDRYINQIAFSGATDFLEKFKDSANAIIGHFGLGFYSAFMVSKQVDIVTKSYKDGSKAMKWSCTGSPEFTMEETEKAGRGTNIVLYIDDDCKEFLEKNKIQELLRKYCHFLPVKIAFGKKTEWKDGKEQETDEDNIINDSAPIWKQKPSELKDEDYLKFYRDLYPGYEEPLFWIHLNVDYPFNLTGVLFFPKIKNELDLRRNKIQLYCNQVFVTDSVENIVPDFLTLLHGVIDSPDIPLNVSRSYLQSDANVKKISKYITKKQYNYIEDAKAKGYSVLIMDGQLDTPLVGMLEQKLEKTRFCRVDGDILSRLIQKDNEVQNAVDAVDADNLSSCFKSQIPAVEKSEFHVEVQSMGKDAQPVTITQSEYMRRMKEMSRLQAGMAFYGEMPDMYSFILNCDHPAVAKINAELKENVADKLKPIDAELRGLKARQTALREEQSKAKDGEFTEEMKKDLDQCNNNIQTEESKKNEIIAAFAKSELKVRHLVDLAMLQNGLLKGKELADFIKRSVELL